MAAPKPPAELALAPMACVWGDLTLAYRWRSRSLRDQRPASKRARLSADSAGPGSETASRRAVAAPLLRPRARDDRGSRQSIAVSSVRSLTNPLFEDRGGVILVEFDQLHELALGAVVAPREQRLHEFVMARVGLDEDAFARLAGAIRRPQCGRLTSCAARVRQRDCA